jgi:molybdate transport system substrate-binding protein
MQDAPFEIFLSADDVYVFKLEQAKKTSGKGVLYASGRLVLFAPHSSTLSVDEQGIGLKAALNERRIQRFAIANPDHAPYGRAAKEALHSLGLWANIQNKLVLGENVSQATQFSIGGSTQGGIFAYSLALTPEVSEQGKFVQLPQQLHQPINHRMVLTKNAGEAARRFYRYVQQSPARAIFEQYGFGLPSE